MAGLVAASPGAAMASPARHDAPATRQDGKLTLAVYGDAPYGTSPTDDSQFRATPGFIDSVNADPQVSEVLHVGDIHSGKQYCTAGYDKSIYDLWQGRPGSGSAGFRDPLVYSPGDNEWTDCHKKAEGGNVTDANGDPVDYANGNPAANLDLIRSIFFAHPGQTLGSGAMRVVSQHDFHDPRHPSDGAYVENVLWRQNDTVFVNVNVPGGSNNDADPWYGAATETPAQTTERTNRTAADLRWLDTAFQVARLTHASGVVIGAQADMWDLDGKPASHLANYEPIISEIATQTKALHRPVLMLNGDSHIYRSDNPLEQGAPCTGDLNPDTGTSVCAYDDWASHPSYSVPNFHRIVVHGSTTPLEWLKLTVDPKGHLPTTDTTFGPFTWERKPQP